MNMLKKNMMIKIGLIFCCMAAAAWAKPLANENLTGLYVRSIEQVLRLEPEEIDIGTAALIVAEEWSDIVHGRRYQTKLDEMAYEVQALINEKGVANSYKAAQVINDYVRNELGFTTVKEAKNPDDLFLHTVIDNKRGYCLSLSILYLALAERLDIPLYGVVVPGHFFVRYENGRVRFNIETTSGGYPDDEYYIDKFKVPQGDDSVYMQNLDKLQTLGCLFNNFGTAYIALDDMDSAQRAMELAVDINPNLGESRVNLGNIYLRKDRVEDAIYEYRRALDINPAETMTYNNLGNAYTRKGWDNDALGAYQEAIRLEPNNVEAYVNLASAYIKKKMYVKAKRLLREAASLDPSRAGIYVKTGDMYFEKENYKKALEEYESALRIDRNSVAAHFGTALCYNKLDMPKNEIRSYEQILKIKPDSFGARVNLGNVYFNQKDYWRAIKEYKICTELDASNAEIFYHIAMAYSRLEKYEEATAFYEKALVLKPEMANAHYNLGVTYYRLKDYPKASKHLTTAEQLGSEVDPKLLKAVERKLR